MRTLAALIPLLIFIYFPVLAMQNSENLQDTTMETRSSEEVAAEPDTNFTYESYEAFLRKISDTSRYLVVPVKEFKKTVNSNKVVIALRHDVDISLSHAFDFSETESKNGFRSTYYILHTAPYYLKNPGDMAVHTESILPVLQKMQSERNFEIGWHNDLVTLQLIYNINPVDFLTNELKWLRFNGINISGSASHGSPYCHTYHYLNFYFFEECSLPVVNGFPNNEGVLKDGQFVALQKGWLADFNLDYEAYFLNNNKYFSDASITNGIRWHTGMLDPGMLSPGDRVIILVHPVHWHKASTIAGIEHFFIPGQKNSYINADNITVTMPFGTDLTSLKSQFRLSPGALVRVNGSRQISGVSVNDFNVPVSYTVYAENRNFSKTWNVRVIPDVASGTTGVEDVEKEEENFFIYPNPSDGVIHLSFTGVERNAQVQIFNFKGEMIYDQILNRSGSFTEDVDLSNEPPGVYIVRNLNTNQRILVVIQ